MAERGFQPPAAVTGYFDGKVDKPAFSWLDVFAEEHAYAFTVAKAVDVELLGAFKSSISAAIAEGKTFERWRGEIQDELQKLGWWGPQRIADPSGADPERLVDFSSDRRLKTIFWSNMRAARAAGQWERIQRAKRGLPFILYVRSAASEPRAEHLRWVGIILPVDDPWWDSHFPPNGWGCKCSVRQISAREAERLLATEAKEGEIRYVSEPPDDGPDLEFRNRRTGEVTKVPAGIDPGWHTNPGRARSRTLIDNLQTRLETSEPGDARAIVEELWEDSYVPPAAKIPERTWLPAGVSPELEAELEAKSPIVSIAADEIEKRRGRHGMTLDDFKRLPAILSQARPFRLSDEENVRTLFSREGRTWWRAAVVRSATGLMRVRTLHQRDGGRIADQLLDAGLGAPELSAAGFNDDEVPAAIVAWKARREKRRRGGREEPPRP